MANFYVSLEFSQFKQGWSENYYYAGANPLNVFTAIQPTLVPRMFCSPPSVLLEAVRVAQVPDNGPPQARPRFGRPFHVNLNGQSSLPSRAPDLVNDAMYYFLTGTGSARRRYELAGLPDEQTIFDSNTGRSLPGPTLGPAANAYMQALVLLSGTSTRTQTPATTPGFGWLDVATLEGAGTTPGIGLVVTTKEAHGLADGDFVSFGRINARVTPNLRGQWQVYGANSTSFRISYYTNLIATTVVQAPPLRVRKVGYALTALGTFEFVRFMKKNVGRPTDVSRGRTRGVSFRR